MRKRKGISAICLISANGLTRQVDPASGSYIDYGLPEGKFIAIMDAPGYYSKAVVIDGSPTIANRVVFPTLTSGLTTRIIPWGDGEIFIPSETVSSLDGQNITFEQGWLWGNGKAENLITIRSGDVLYNNTCWKICLGAITKLRRWLYILMGRRVSVEQVHPY